jgi:hypothetical protein
VPCRHLPLESAGPLRRSKRFLPARPGPPPPPKQLSELEEAVQERDAMAARLALLEARLDETRVERGQVGGWVGRGGGGCSAGGREGEGVTSGVCPLYKASLVQRQAQV